MPGNRNGFPTEMTIKTVNFEHCIPIPPGCRENRFGPGGPRRGGILWLMFLMILAGAGAFIYFERYGRTGLVDRSTLRKMVNCELVGSHSGSAMIPSNGSDYPCSVRLEIDTDLRVTKAEWTHMNIKGVRQTAKWGFPSFSSFSEDKPGKGHYDITRDGAIFRLKYEGTRNEAVVAASFDFPCDSYRKITREVCDGLLNPDPEVDGLSAIITAMIPNFDQATVTRDLGSLTLSDFLLLQKAAEIAKPDPRFQAMAATARAGFGSPNDYALAGAILRNIQIPGNVSVDYRKVEINAYNKTCNPRSDTTFGLKKVEPSSWRAKVVFLKSGGKYLEIMDRKLEETVPGRVPGKSRREFHPIRYPLSEFTKK